MSKALGTVPIKASGAACGARSAGKITKNTTKQYYYGARLTNPSHNGDLVLTLQSCGFLVFLKDQNTLGLMGPADKWKGEDGVFRTRHEWEGIVVDLVGISSLSPWSKTEFDAAFVQCMKRWDPANGSM